MSMRAATGPMRAVTGATTRSRASFVVVATSMSALALAGCSSGITAIAPPGPLPYQHASAFMPAGYSESIIGPDRYRIEVKGPIGTSRERLEKIAATRAAEIGRDGKLKYFKIEGMQHSTSCKTFTTGGKPGSMGAGESRKSALAILTADVAYAKTPADQSYLESKPTFERYRAELDQDQTPPAPIDPSTPQCG